MSLQENGHFFNFNSRQELVPPEETMPIEPSTPTPTTTTTANIPSTIPPPPTNQVFEAPEQALDFVRHFARCHGFSVAKRRSKRDSDSHSIMSAIYLRCDRGRAYDLQCSPDSAERKQSNNARVDCPFDAVVRYSKERKQYFLDSRNPSHNHAATAPATPRPARRKRARKEKNSVNDNEGYIGVSLQHLNPSSRRLNIGIIGLDTMGQHHALNTLHLVPRANLVCLLSTVQGELSWADKFCKPYGVHVTSTFEDMIAMPGLEAVIITSVPIGGADCIAGFIERGIHVMCENSAILSPNELSNLITKANSKPGTKFMAASPKCFDADYASARVDVMAGQIGLPLVIHSQGCDNLDRSGLSVQNSRGCGGIFVEIGIHHIDLTLSLFGDRTRPKALWATGIGVGHGERDSDNAVGVVEFWGDKIAYYHLSRTMVHGQKDTTEIFGTKGKLSVNPAAGNTCIKESDKGGVCKEPTLSSRKRYVDAYLVAIREFTTCVLDGKEIPLGSSSSLTSLRVAMGLQESLITGQKVEFDEQGNRATANWTTMG